MKEKLIDRYMIVGILFKNLARLRSPYAEQGFINLSS